MEKSYDRVSWSYICLILRKMGFDEVFIDMVWIIMDTIGTQSLSMATGMGS